MVADISPQKAEAPPYDVEAVIAEFVADSSRDSLELPRTLTAEQRKRAKGLAEQHPELKCESYGFGSERQLHLFKRNGSKSHPAGRAEAAPGQNKAAMPGAGTGAVSVKNTFIDDWVGADSGDAVSEPVIFRSVPPKLSHAKQGSIEPSPDLSTISEGVAKEPAPRAGSPGRSTSAASGGVPSSPSGGSASSSRELPAQQALSVRNTFIHLEGVPSVDERAVQSMPDGMFRQCLLQEAALAQAAVQAAPPAPPAAPPPPAPPTAPAPTYAPMEDPAAPVLAWGPPQTAAEARLLLPGSGVLIYGLQKAPAFNGLQGTVHGFDEETNRYSIRIPMTTNPGGYQMAKVKYENLLKVS